MSEKTVNYLLKTRFFTGLDQKQLSDIASQMRDQRFRSGERIFARGDKGGHVYLVMQGLVIISNDLRHLVWRSIKC